MTRTASGVSRAETRESLPARGVARSGVGYVVSLEGVRIYHSGSTELVPELKAVRADLAVLAFWEGYVMSTQDAADLARSLRATIVIPTHCKPEEAVKLRDLLKGATQVELVAVQIGEAR